ncbi:MAG: precorrin-6y C5,15-methyltransferase (decarboxylating) subunit CbiE [Desulfomonilaceae bacterium]|jgi:precorrin-6y C5,15-methyltransferase (decarboxylating) CbiE subunit
MAELPKIMVVGCGPGSPDYISGAAGSTVKRATTIVGTERLLGLFPDSCAERLVMGSEMNAALDKIEKAKAMGPVAVLVSGDPGLFSFARMIVKRFGRDEVRFVPGISSAHVAFARLALDWADARIISAHMADPGDELSRSLAVEPKIAVLLGRLGSMKWLQEFLQMYPAPRRIFVFENLTLEDETVREVSCEKLEGLRVSSRSVVVMVHPDLLE